MFSTVALPTEVNFEKGVYIAEKGPLMVMQQYLLDIKQTDNLPAEMQHDIAASNPGAGGDANASAAAASSDVRKFVLPQELLGAAAAPTGSCQSCSKAGATKLCSRCKVISNCSKPFVTIFTDLFDLLRTRATVAKNVSRSTGRCISSAVKLHSSKKKWFCFFRKSLYFHT